jgi:hypothetical protein
VIASGTTIASPWRRVAAWVLDYLVIAAYLILLTAASIVTSSSRAGSLFSSALSRSSK